MIKKLLLLNNDRLRPFVQPVLTSNGTLGGSSFAVYGYDVQGTNYAYKTTDKNINTFWETNYTTYPTPFYFEWYNPYPLLLTSINIVNFNIGTYGVIKDYTIYGSNDGSSWVSLTSGRNTNTSPSGSWSIPISTNVFYKYFKLKIDTGYDNYPGFAEGTLQGYEALT